MSFLTSSGSSGPTPAGTGAETNVASSNADGVILAANAARLLYSVFNDSTQILYLLEQNAVSSAINHTVQITAGAYYTPPINYTGVVKGIWAAVNGSARVTEYTA